MAESLQKNDSMPSVPPSALLIVELGIHSVDKPVKLFETELDVKRFFKEGDKTRSRTEDVVVGDIHAMEDAYVLKRDRFPVPVREV